MEKKNKNIANSEDAIIDALNAFTKRSGRIPSDGERFVTVFNNFALLLERNENSYFAEVFLDPIRINKTYDFEIDSDEDEIEVKGTLGLKSGGNGTCLS